jgi:choline dehydrogenase-like flavoprotein
MDADSQAIWDVVIIGSGAGGGTLAQRLAPTGKRILLLERGDFIARERANWDVHEVVDKGRYRADETFLDREDKPFRPFTHYCVGGNTKMYGAALLRMRESDFRETPHFDGISAGWPLDYRDFAPYYAQAEQLYSVHGQRGTDPCEPPGSEPYPHGPLPHEPRIAELARGLSGVGLRPFPIPLGVRLPQDSVGSHARMNLTLFDGFPDPTECKADAHVVAVNQALAHPNVRLWTGAYVSRLLTSTSGREVSEIVVQRGPETLHVRAHIVVVACGAIQSAALLLRSQNASHPDGLANDTGMVGRHYMSHNNGALIAYSGDVPNRSEFQKTFAITDYYHGAPDSPYPLGLIQLMGRSDPSTLRDSFANVLPDHSVEDLALHTVDFWLTAEDLAKPDNRVTLTSNGTLRIAYQKTNREAYARLKRALIDKLEQAEPNTRHAFAGYELDVSGVSHQCGTLRFGRDPRSSVLDVNCKAHALDNLYVVDASFFCSSGAVNPSLTIMANALRVGDHLAERLR